MNQLEYVPGIGGQSVQLDGPSSFVGIAENLRSREWEYDLGYRDLVSATRPAREVDVTFDADYATADDLRRVADADVTARTPGIFIAQKEWRQRGYILASQPNDIHYGRLSAELKVALLDGAWWRLVDKTFAVEDTTPTYESATGKSVTTDGAANVPLHALTVDGEAVQDGTPTPNAPIDVEVVQGINLLVPRPRPATTMGGITYTAHDDGSIEIRGTATSDADWVISNLDANPLAVPTGSYAFSIGGLVSGVKFIVSGGGGRNGFPYREMTSTSPTTTGTVTDASKPFNYIMLRVSSGTTVNTTVYPQLEKGSTATPYVPYGSIGLNISGTITPIHLQGNVLASLPDGTKDVLTVDSVGHCVLEKRVGKYDVGTLNWVDASSPSAHVFRTNIYGQISSSDYPVIPNRNILPNAMMRKYARDTWAHISGSSNGFFAIGIASATDQRLVIVDYNYSDSSLFAASLNGELLYYELAIPQTIDLGYIDMPNVFDGAVVSITAEVTPTITAEWQTSPDIYLDYPHNYPYDYQKTSSTESITPSVLTPSDVRLVIYGPAVNPYVIVGGNRYQVNATVPSGGYLVVDGRDKTINMTLADGTVQNVFSSGVRGGGAGGGSYIFEKVPAGTSEVTYDGSFGFDLGWYEEEGEPPWNQS